MLEFLVLLAVFFVSLHFYVARKYNHWKKKNVSFFPPVPFFGNAFKMFQLKRSIGCLLFDFYKKTTQPFVGFFILDDPCLLIKDLELAKDVLVKNFDIFNDRTMASNYKDDPMGSHMLFVMKNPEWKDERRKVTPSYTTGKMRNFHKLIEECADSLIKFLDKEVESGREVHNSKYLAFKFTTDAITSTAFGLNANSFEGENAQFLKASTKIFNWSVFERSVATTLYFISPFLVKWLGLRFVDKESSDFLRQAFWDAIKERQRTSAFRNDLIDILISSKEAENFDEKAYKLEGDQIVSQGTQFFIGGSETSSTTISFALYELARHPTLQNRLRKEINEFLAKHGSFTYDSLNKLEYLDMVVKETLRRYPVVPFLDRRAASDYKIPGTEIVLEKGTKVFISVLGIHYDSNYYPDPEKFDPEHFTPENVESRPTSTFLAFGEGPRHCIGARFGSISSKTAISRIISKFQVEICEKTQNPMKFDQRGFLIAPIGGIYLRFKKCNENNLGGVMPY